MAKDSVVRKVRASAKAGPTKGEMVAAKSAHSAAEGATTRGNKRRVPSLGDEAAKAASTKKARGRKGSSHDEAAPPPTKKVKSAIVSAAAIHVQATIHGLASI
jgi:hypothetical protein